MDMKNAAERKAAERARRRAEGLKPFEIWLRPQEWPLVKAYVARLRRRKDKK
jgi:hypothetical protein